jgi:hypothetical protein
MRKTISLKLTPDEERIVDLIRGRGVSHSILLRDALKHYFNLVDQKVYHLTGVEVNQKVDQVNHFTGEEVNQKVDQVNRFTGDAVDQVDQSVDHFTGESVNPKVDLVDQKVNPVDRTDNYLALYIEQLNTRMHQLENETQEWKAKHLAEVQYLKDSYNLLQTEYHNQVKDSINRIDEKFNRIMFYLEESHKPALHTIDVKSDPKTKSDSIVDDDIKVEKKISVEKAKKGWTFKLYRM